MNSNAGFAVRVGAAGGAPPTPLFLPLVAVGDFGDCVGVVAAAGAGVIEAAVPSVAAAGAGVGAAIPPKLGI